MVDDVVLARPAAAEVDDRDPDRPDVDRGHDARRTQARSAGRPAPPADAATAPRAGRTGPPVRRPSHRIARPRGRFAARRPPRRGRRQHRHATRPGRATPRTARASPRAAARRGHRRSGARSTRAPRPRCPRSGPAPGSCRSAARPSAGRCRPPPRRSLARAPGRDPDRELSARADLDVHHQRVEPRGELLGQDRADDQRDRLDRSVASRIAYSRRSAGARRAVCPTIAQPARATTSRRRSVSGVTP